MPNAMKNTALFQVLAPRIESIPQERLLFELCLVRENAKINDHHFNPERDLNGGFTWANSPQGQNFWETLWVEYARNR